jgi:ArsR family transcriptional regulator
MGDPSAATSAASVVRAPIDAGRADNFARMFKAVGDPVRLRLLSMIASARAGEVCVNDLTGEFELSGPTISHHLKVLRDAGLLTSERRASWVYYAVVPEVLASLSSLLSVSADVAPVAVATA